MWYAMFRLFSIGFCSVALSVFNVPPFLFSRDVVCLFLSLGCSLALLQEWHHESCLMLHYHTHTHTTDHILYPYSHIPPTTHIYPWRERRMSSFVPDSGWWRYRAGTKQTMPRFGYILRFQIPDRFLWFWLLMTLLLLLLFMLLVFYDVLFWCDVVVIVDNYYDLVW